MISNIIPEMAIRTKRRYINSSSLEAITPLSILIMPPCHFARSRRRSGRIHHRIDNPRPLREGAVLTGLPHKRCFCPERKEGPDPCEAHWRHCSLHSLLRFDRHVDAEGQYNCVECVTRSLNPEDFLQGQM